MGFKLDREFVRGGGNNMKKISACIVGASILALIFTPIVSSVHPGLDKSNTTITAIQSSTKWAVLIAASGGESYWHHEILEKHDIRDFKRILLDHGWEQDHIRVILEEEATSDAIMNTSVEWLNLNGADEDDLILYFFNMHGYYLKVDLPPIDEPDGKDEFICLCFLRGFIGCFRII